MPKGLDGKQIPQKGRACCLAHAPSLAHSNDVLSNLGLVLQHLQRFDLAGQGRAVAWAKSRPHGLLAIPRWAYIPASWNF